MESSTKSQTTPNIDKATIISVTTEIQRLAALKSVKLNPYSTHSMKYFCGFAQEKRQSIVQSLSTYLEILSSASGAQLAARKITLKEECEYLTLTCEKFGLKLAEGDYNFVAEGDIVEVYLLEGIQIYRNFQFFDQCSYDLMMLSTYQWYELYERAQLVTTAIFDAVKKIAEGQQTGLLDGSSCIPAHTLRERHLNAHRVFSVGFKYLMPLLDVHTNQIKGFISTSHSDIIAEGQSADKVAHI